MTFTYFGSFAAVGNEPRETKLIRPERKLRENDCLFEARFLHDIWGHVEVHKGKVYDMDADRYIPLAGYEFHDDGSFTIFSEMGRSRKVKAGTWLLYSERNLDYLPVAA